MVWAGNTQPAEQEKGAGFVFTLRGSLQVDSDLLGTIPTRWTYSPLFRKFIMDFDETRKFSTGLFQQLQLICDYSIEIYTMITSVLEKSSRENTIYGTYSRAVLLLKTLRKCNNVGDCQTILHANRALIEIVTDLIFQKHDKTDDTNQKIRAWEKSSKLKEAQKILRYFQKIRQPVPSHCLAKKIYIKTEETHIKSLRHHFWPNLNGRHPPRWTGNNLDQDVIKADSLEGTSLEKYYNLEYGKMNWMTHGSGLAGIREFNEEGFFNLVGLAYGLCGKLGILAMKIVLEEFGFFQSDIYKNRWEDRNRDITIHIAPFLPAEEAPEN